jgi:hypothetical protein
MNFSRIVIVRPCKDNRQSAKIYHRYWIAILYRSPTYALRSVFLTQSFSVLVMDTQRIRCLLSICDELSVTHAAQNCGLESA